MEYKKNNSKNLSTSIKLIIGELAKDCLGEKQIFIFSIIFIIGIITRLIHLSQPIKEDEAMTFLSYIEPNNPFRLFVYTYPNNHIFHSILVKISTLFFGISVVAIRLPAFFSSIGIIYLIYAICRRFGQSGILGAIACAIWPYLIAYSSNARGYSLFCFLSLLLVYVYLITRLNFERFNLIIISIISALGLYTIPTFVMFLVAIYSWISIDQYLINKKGRRNILKKNIFLLFITSLFTIVLYIPAFVFSSSGILAITNNNFVEGLTISEYFNSISGHIHNIIFSLSQELPSFYLYFLLLLFLFGIFSYIRDSKVFHLILFPLILISSITIISLKLVIPPVRIWIFLIPFFLIVADKGFSSLIINLKESNKLKTKLLIILFSIILINPLLTKNVIDIEHVSYPNSETAIKYLESQRILQKKDTIGAYVIAGSSMSLNYYNLLNDGKVYFDNQRLYRKKSFYESFKDDFQRFKNSNFQDIKKRNKEDFEYFIYDTRYLEESNFCNSRIRCSYRNLRRNKTTSSYQDLVINNRLVMKSGTLEIYSAK